MLSGWTPTQRVNSLSRALHCYSLMFQLLHILALIIRCELTWINYCLKPLPLPSCTSDVTGHQLCADTCTVAMTSFI